MASKESMSTKDMVKFWAIGAVALIIVAFVSSIILFGFVASIFGA